jgi:1,2-diacylglycerol 3-beta-galactosyltransferase
MEAFVVADSPAAPVQRILILMSMTGGGHRASALALKAGFEHEFPGRFQIDIVDILTEHTFWPLNHSPQIYSLIASEAPWLWGVAYSTEMTPTLTRGAVRLAGKLAQGRIRAALDQYKPDLVISVHPLAQEITLHVLARRPARSPFVTVVTDLASVHPLWLTPRVDALYLASEEALAAARGAGVPPTRTHLLGLPIRPAFAEPPLLTRAALRAELGMDPGLPAVILMGGGDGVGPVEAIAVAVDKAFAAQRIKAQIVVVCGRNEGLRSRLAARHWINPAHILGFVENMPDWMHACDAVITKAGPGTIAEACVCGLPILLSGFIPGQEEGNVTYVVSRGAGALESNPTAIGRTLAHWFGAGSAERLRMAARARALGRPHATADIVHSVVRLMDEWDA